MHAGGAMDEGRKDYAILISLAMREEAEVMASALRAEGIDAFTCSIAYNWHLTLAFGGIQVWVPSQRLDEAREAIRTRMREARANADGEPVGRRDRWKMWAVIAVSIVVAYLPGWIADTIGQAGQLSQEAFDALERQQQLDYCGAFPNDYVYEAGEVFRTECRTLLARQ